MTPDARATRVIVTRPERESNEWVEQLKKRGFRAEALPLIEISASRNPFDAEALRTAWEELAGYAACLFVSANAVSHFFKPKEAVAQSIRAEAAIKYIADRTSPEVPSRVRFLAPGPGTAAALRASGVPADQIDAPAADAEQFDSQALWRVVGPRDWQGLRVLIVRGQTAHAQRHDAPDGSAPGRDWIARQWTAAGAAVDFLCVYERHAPQLTSAQRKRAKSASTDGSVWLLSSSEAVENLTATDVLHPHDLRKARAVATHPRIAAAARAAGWGVVVESRPQLESIAEALARVASIELSDS